MAQSAGTSFSGFLILMVVAICLAAPASAQFDRDFAVRRRPPSARPPSGRHAGRRMVQCTRRREFPFCYLIKKPCPDECRRSCHMNCRLCKAVCHCAQPGAVCQDPRFIGGDGITFYFHGQKDSDFCLVTDRDLHINAHLIGQRVAGHKRDFTWVQSVGVLFQGDHRLLIGARRTSLWADEVDRLELAFDGEAITLPPAEGAKWHSKLEAPRLSVTRTRDANCVSVDAAGKLSINAAVVPITKEDAKIHGYNITDDDCFAHLDLRFKFHSLSDEVDGVLGRTYRKNYTSKVNVRISMPVLGGEREFATSHIFSTDCAASRFLLAAVAAETGEEDANKPYKPALTRA